MRKLYSPGPKSEGGWYMFSRVNVLPDNIFRATCGRNRLSKLDGRLVAPAGDQRYMFGQSTLLDYLACSELGLPC